MGIELHSWKQGVLTTVHTKSSGLQGKGSAKPLFSFVVNYSAYQERLSVAAQVSFLKGNIDAPEHQGEISGL